MIKKMVALITVLAITITFPIIYKILKNKIENNNISPIHNEIKKADPLNENSMTEIKDKTEVKKVNSDINTEEPTTFIKNAYDMVLEDFVSDRIDLKTLKYQRSFDAVGRIFLSDYLPEYSYCETKGEGFVKQIDMYEDDRGVKYCFFVDGNIAKLVCIRNQLSSYDSINPKEPDKNLTEEIIKNNAVDFAKQWVPDFETYIFDLCKFENSIYTVRFLKSIAGIRTMDSIYVYLDSNGNAEYYSAYCRGDFDSLKPENTDKYLKNREEIIQKMVDKSSIVNGERLNASYEIRDEFMTCRFGKYYVDINLAIDVEKGCSAGYVLPIPLDTEL